jgi:hypothetical protein
MGDWQDIMAEGYEGRTDDANDHRPHYEGPRNLRW